MNVRAAIGFVAFLGVALSGACDPVGDAQIDALGPEAPGVRRGPLHRPGQPCLVCHDGAIGDPPAFSVAGTIYETPASSIGLEGATVTMQDANRSSPPVAPITNAAGNFYVTPEQWTPKLPLGAVSVTSVTGGFAIMYSDIGRNGGCANCHVRPAGPMSPGPVVLLNDEGGTPL